MNWLTPSLVINGLLLLPGAFWVWLNSWLVECGVAFTQQQVDQDLLPGQRVTPREAHNGANDPRDAVARERQQGHHGATASPGGRRVGAHPHALGQTDVNGEEGVYGYPLEWRVQQHAVLLWHLAGLPLVLAAVVGGFLARLARLVLDLTRSPCAAPALRGAAAGAASSRSAAAAGVASDGLMVQWHELWSAQDAVPLPRPGSHIVTGGHVLDRAESFVGATSDCQSPEDNSSGASPPRRWNVPG